jgi:phosphoglycolate phosphatase-like HAD superfamily hydrolase
MARVLLFDIDNTLLYSGGAGSLAMGRAFEQLYGVANGFTGIEFSGRTDRFILQSGLENHDIPGGCEAHLDEFTARYYALLPDAMRERAGHLMPGFPQLLEALSGVAGVRLGLATGNFGEAAGIKLGFYDIDRYFAGGGFGELSLERADVVRAAIEAVADGARPEDVLVIGDTPHDVTSALDNGVIAVGVATGTYGVDDLRASGAHVAFADFSDWCAAAEALLAFRP